jgi:hypothetical protein
MTATSRNRESGQALIMVSLSMVAMFGLLGLVVDIGWMHFRVEAAQTAADSAASAAAEAAFASSGGSITCGSNNVICQAATSCPNPVPSSPVKDTDIACAYAKSNGFAITTGGRQTVTVAAGTGTVPTVSGATVAYWITARVSESVPQLFSAVQGNTTGTIGAVATAAISGTVSGTCIYLLSPTATHAFSITGSSTLTTSGCGIYDNSTNAAAFYAFGSPTVTASSIQVRGGTSISGASTVNPAPTTGAPLTTDPLAALPAPAVGACNTLTTAGTGYSLSHSQTATLSQGVYCGGISVSGNSVATLNPGTYILNGGGLSVANSAQLSGTGVTFFNTAQSGYTPGPVTVTGAGTVNLSAPTSGAYQGVLFFQDRNITYAAANAFANSASGTMTGTFYFPTTAVNYTGNVGAAIYDAFIASTLSITGSSSFKNDTTGAYTGLAKQQASLIQ